jgi:predicted RNase H-like HicB family nuclease
MAAIMKIMDSKFTAVFRKEGDWWAAYVEELPGANTQGRTLEEARTNLREVVSDLLDVNQEIAAESSRETEIIREELVVSGR